MDAPKIILRPNMNLLDTASKSAQKLRKIAGSCSVHGVNNHTQMSLTYSLTIDIRKKRVKIGGHQINTLIRSSVLRRYKRDLLFNHFQNAAINGAAIIIAHDNTVILTRELRCGNDHTTHGII